MRKHVKPAHPEAAIPDPVRGGDLPPEGLTVEWSVHWARLAQRGDVIVKDVDEDEAPAKAKRPAGKGSKSDDATSVPTGDAPVETSPQPDGPELDAPATPGAPEPSIT